MNAKQDGPDDVVMSRKESNNKTYSQILVRSYRQVTGEPRKGHDVVE
jgi:hypothetical protein